MKSVQILGLVLVEELQLSSFQYTFPIIQFLGVGSMDDSGSEYGKDTRLDTLGGSIRSMRGMNTGSDTLRGSIRSMRKGSLKQKS